MVRAVYQVIVSGVEGLGPNEADDTGFRLMDALHDPKGFILWE